MKLKLTLLALTILLIFVFPQRALAIDGREVIVRFETQDGVSRLVYDELYFTGKFSDRERAWAVFYNLLCMGGCGFVPEGVRLLGVTLALDELIINVSAEINNYGGTCNEKHLLAQIVLTGLKQRGVDAVTLLIEGEPAVLPEGSAVYRLTALDVR
jgi:hypothetical protein